MSTSFLLVELSNLVLIVRTRHPARGESYEGWGASIREVVRHRAASAQRAASSIKE
ncbi:hypothetical protein [Paraburkholderia bannensis]|uniref:hypothetical protein n=1 Tax=Paraburkholderia bannensis TaxID=765414 RepID=UPI0012EC65AD|nr:hypothetical protein [Paraburkholderia bannensis]